MAKTSLTPVQQRQVLFAVLGLIGLTAWLSLFLFPQQRALGPARLQMQELRAQVDQTQRGLAQMPAMELQIAQLTAQYQLPAVTQPPEQQLPELLEEISRTARQAQVRIVASKPSTDVSKLSPGPSGYLEFQILIAASGGYHQIGNFLDALEHSNHLLKIRELGVLSDPEQITRHTAIFLFQAYLVPARLNSEGE